jgi:hypothetical protein
MVKKGRKGTGEQVMLPGVSSEHKRTSGWNVAGRGESDTEKLVQHFVTVRRARRWFPTRQERMKAMRLAKQVLAIYDLDTAKEIIDWLDTHSKYHHYNWSLAFVGRMGEAYLRSSKAPEEKYETIQIPEGW